MQRKGVAEIFKRRQAKWAAAELKRRKVAFATSVITTSASGAIAVIIMATVACGH
jgi:hypothetical protein